MMKEYECALSLIFKRTACPAPTQQRTHALEDVHHRKPALSLEDKTTANYQVAQGSWCAHIGLYVIV